MNIHELKNSIDKLAKTISENEKVFLPAFAAKLATATKEFPSDKTIGQMNLIVKKMAASKQLTISRRDIKDLYTKLYTYNTKFANLFHDELGEEIHEPEVKYTPSLKEANYNLTTLAFEKIADPILKSQLDVVFGTKEAKAFCEVTAEKASKICESQLQMLGITASKIEAKNGNASMILCNASFETPKGLTHILIPVEIQDGKVSLASVFVGNNGPQMFNKENLVSYIKSSVGKKLEVTASQVITAYNTLTNTTGLSKIALAATKMKAEKEQHQVFASEQIMYHDFYEEPDTGLKTPEFKDSEIESFTEKMASSVGIANFSFGEKKVNLGRELVANKLNEFGYKTNKISVFASDNESVSYAVSLNNGSTGFIVPVKIANENVMSPEVIIINKSIKSFSKSNIDNACISKEADVKALAAASSLYNVKADELVEIVRKGAQEQNFAKVEDALNVLASSGNEKAYKYALHEYMSVLNQKEVKKCACTRIVKSPNSKYEICGHTNLPLHKVAQDEFGNCIPLYRKDMDNTFDPGLFTTSKIFF